jgi:hypothetical protein
LSLLVQETAEKRRRMRRADDGDADHADTGARASAADKGKGKQRAD